MHYRVLFDAAQVGYRTWWCPAAGLLVAALVIVIARRDGRGKPILPVALCLLWSGFVFRSTFSEYWGLRTALRSGHYRTVEGRVTAFSPEPEGDHRAESFTVAGCSFSYNAASPTCAFNWTHSHGGPIHDGLAVRIADVNGRIARLESAE